MEAQQTVTVIEDRVEDPVPRQDPVPSAAQDQTALDLDLARYKAGAHLDTLLLIHLKRRAG